MNQRWYCIQSKPGEELRASAGILDQGFQVFLPQERKVIRPGNRKQWVLRPLFPNYFFALFDAREVAEGGDDWGPILHTRGVHAVLRTGGRPAPVPTDVIAYIQGYCRAREEDAARPARPRIPFAPGTVVTINSGPFTGFEALVQEDARQRVVVLLDILGKRTPILLSHEAVDARPCGAEG